MQKYKIWLLLLVATAVAYGGSLKYGFSQDDYYFLLISKASSLGDVLKFFSPWHQQGFAFFRPLGTQLYYYLFTGLFGLSGAPFAMHIFMLLIQACNAYLVYQLIVKLSGKQTTSLLLALVYATSSVHFLSLYYIAATQQLLAATFSLLSLNYFLDKKYLVSGLWLIPALLCKESALVTPGIAALLSFYAAPRFNWRAIIQRLTSYIGVISLYLVIRFLAGLHVQSEYQPVIGPSLLSTLRWYVLFGYGAPEELLRYGLSGFGIRFAQFVRDFGYLGLVSLASTCSLTLFAISRSLSSLTRGWPFTLKQISLLLMWFVTGVILIVWYPDHRYPHYLDLSLIPLLYLVFSGLSDRWQACITLALILASLTAIMISAKVHWTTGRANLAHAALTEYDWGEICKHDNIIFVGEGSGPLELSYALSLTNGPRVICDKPGLGVYYTGMDSNIPGGTYAIQTEKLGL